MTPFDGMTETSACEQQVFLDDVVTGLGRAPKSLSPKYFYDSVGSELFDAICDLPEYYVTRTETAILEQHAGAIADELGVCRLVEPGAGSSTKTRLLLRALGERCTEYVPVDIAGDHLERSAATLRTELPWLRVTPLAGDFSVELAVPAASGDERTVIYFPGSTLGNFDPEDAKRLLARFARAAGMGGSVLVGIDLKKDPQLLHAAYNDAQGVTAAFNKNVLRRMNDELGADVDLDAFHHYAFYAPNEGRIEMHLVSARSQTLHVGSHAFELGAGESICTERSYKYDVAGAAEVANAVGLRLRRTWLDAAERFAVLLFDA